MDSQILDEFMSKTDASKEDAIACLSTWDWDLKQALIDYNDTKNIYPQSKPKQLNIELKANTTTDQMDSYNKKLERGISRATDNANIVSLARSQIEMDFHTNYHNTLENSTNYNDSSDYTFTLPDFSKYHDEFRSFLEKDLIECSTLSALQQSNCLNWWLELGLSRKLWPLATTGDGNCLLHAASLGIWGFHDRKLTLRSALYNLLAKSQYKYALYRRWRFQQTRLNKQAGFVFSEIEWAKEWEEIVSIASPEPRYSTKEPSRRRSMIFDRFTDSNDSSVTYESLEEIHILALAHVLKRTIIVIADKYLRDMNGDAMAPIPFGGIYLPFEVSPNDCYRGPLILAYDMAHFSALVTMESEEKGLPSLVPLVNCDNVLLPIQFCIDPGDNFVWQNYDGDMGSWELSDKEQVALLHEYMDVSTYMASGSPEEDIFDDLADTELEKQISEGTISIDDQLCDSDNGASSKNKAKMQSVAKHFGSLGKSMSKKWKKNIGSITKIGSISKGSKKDSVSSYSDFNASRQRYLCGKLNVKRHEFRDKMVQNYMDRAYDRFMCTEMGRLATEKNPSSPILKETPAPIVVDLPTQCVNVGCTGTGNSNTSYMCKTCYNKQKEKEKSSGYYQGAPRYGTGNSQFYTETDLQSHESIKNLPAVKPLQKLDRTLYLSNSTFFNDQVAPIETLTTATAPIRKIGVTSQSRPIISLPPFPNQECEPSLRNLVDTRPIGYNSPLIDLESPTYRSIAEHGSNSRDDNRFSQRPMNYLNGYKPTLCLTSDCKFFASASSDFCSKCSRRSHYDNIPTHTSSGKILSDV